MKRFNSRNAFNLSHENKLTCDIGNLVPIYVEEVLPGDVFRVSSQVVMRLAPMLAPIMHQVDLFTHFFFVPTRLIYDDWEDFITGGKDGHNASVVPTIKAPETTGFIEGSLGDYLGVPTGVPELEVLAFPFRAYDLIYNQWYRDENLQEELVISKASGLDTTTSKVLKNRCFKKDYFTSCLPWQQRGENPVYLPLGQSAPVVYGEYKTGVGLSYPWTGEGGSQNGNPVYARGDSSSGAALTSKTAETGSNNGYPLVTDLSEATSATINDIRTAFQIQRWLEKSAIYGCRYVEQILAHFNVRTPDYRVQRAEFLGGGRSPVIISEVLQTSSTVGGEYASPQGNMSGHGFSAQRSHSFKHRFTEHGYVMGIMSILPKASYQQGLNRMWNRRSRTDWYWPVFSHLGEQAVLNKELYAQNTDADNETFGFQGRYDEYRHHYSSVHGTFRSSLNFWHLGRIFSEKPTLNENFIVCNPETTKRIFSVPGMTDHCWCDIYNKVHAIRPIPKRSTPGYIDHD